MAKTIKSSGFFSFLKTTYSIHNAPTPPSPKKTTEQMSATGLRGNHGPATTQNDKNDAATEARMENNSFISGYAPPLARQMSFDLDSVLKVLEFNFPSTPISA
jgi:hypothetical protein